MLAHSYQGIYGALHAVAIAHLQIKLRFVIMHNVK